MIYDIPKLNQYGLEAFFSQANSLDSQARQRFFYELFPYAEQIPGSIALMAPNSKILGCNDYSWKQIHLENINQLIDHTSADAEMLLKWPKHLVGQAVLHDAEAMKTGLSIHEEVIVQGDIEKTLICRKEAIYDQHKRPIGVLCVALATHSGNQKVKLSADGSRVFLLLDPNKAIHFSKREFMTLQLLLRGLSTEEMSHLFSISSKTIQTYIMRIKEKLDCDKQREIIALLLKHDAAKAVLNFTLQ